MNRRAVADICAGVVGAVVLTIGAVTLIGDNDVLAPSSKTTVTKKAVAHGSPATKTTTTTTRPADSGGKAKPTTTKTIETTTGSSKPEETTVTGQDGERTFAERVLGSGGIIVLQLAALLLAAFVSAAATQRVVMGQYGFKFGGLELGELADSSAEGIAAVNAKVDALAGDVVGLKDGLSLAYTRISLIEHDMNTSED